MLSNIHAIKKNFDLARKFLHRGFSIQPQNTSILNNLGTAYKELGKIQESINYYEKVLELNSNHTNANYNLGLIYYQLKQLDKAKMNGSRFVRLTEKAADKNTFQNLRKALNIS